jgi:pilus assembly protein CpaF
MTSPELAGNPSDEEIRSAITGIVNAAHRENYLPIAERTRISRELFYSVRRLDILQDLVEDPEVVEIMVNGPDRIFVEKGGVLLRLPRGFSSPEKLDDVIQQIVGRCNRVINERSPIVDARLSDGSRVNAVISPAALNGPILTIRRFPKEPITMDKLIRLGSITEEAAVFLEDLVRAGYSSVISGGTSAGKTTFLNALSNYIPKNERIITIEDNAELQIQGVRNLVRLEARRANAEGDNEVTIRDLIRSSLRMRPDRIIVGEVRGEETIDMLQSLNTGHDGSLSTGHGNSPKDMLSRLETMVLMGLEIPIAAIRRQIASGIDIMVHLSRMRDKSRKVLEILEIDGYDVPSGEILTHTIFSYEANGEDEDGRLTGEFRKVGRLNHTQKLERAGIRLEEDGACGPEGEICRGEICRGEICI